MSLEKIETSGDQPEVENIYTRPFEEILEVSEIIEFNDSVIEIPNVVIYKNVKKIGKVASFLLKISETQTPIIEVEEGSFNKMLSLLRLKDSENSLILVKSVTLPERQYIINKELIAKKALIVRYSKERGVLKVNEDIFVIDSLEYHGLGMFVTNRVYKLTAEDFSSLLYAILN